MSTITVTNIKATGETASRFATGVAAAWVLYNGDTSGGAVLDSVNISSVTDSATGNFRTNFSSNMANVNYSSVGMSRVYHINSAGADDKTVTGEKHQTFYVSNTSGGRTDFDLVRNAVNYHGDLA